MDPTHQNNLPDGDSMRKNTSTIHNSPASSNRPLSQEQEADIALWKLATDAPDVVLSPAKSSPSLLDKQKPTQATAVAINARSNVGWEKRVQHPWLVPYAAEDQKHAWHNSCLGMDSKVVTDEWGFHSTSASRSHSPNGAK